MKWLRGTFAVAACAASAVDAEQSARYVDGRHGLVEANGFLANPNGTVNTARMIGFKAGMCAVPLMMAFVPSHREYLKPLSIPLSIPALTVYTAVDVHNQMLIDKHK